MKKTYLVLLAVILLILLGVSYWYQRTLKNETATTATTSENVMPSVSTNPLNNKPNINPVDQTNPFKNVKTNPFE